LAPAGITQLLSFEAQQPSACNFAYETDLAGNTWVYSACNCSSLNYASIGSTSFSPYVFTLANGPAMDPAYPATSQWVTAVGATAFTWAGGVITGEISTSLKNFNGLVTSGGGFSTLIPMPSYQRSVVDFYLDTHQLDLPPSNIYNKSGRAFPDVSLNGHFFLIAESNATGSCPCASGLVDGTSCSSPSLAGMISLINNELLSLGKKPVGFLNPQLYNMHALSPQSFHDIVEGDSFGTEAFYVCTFGFFTAPGWDPVTGLGSPDWIALKNFLINGGSSSAAQLSSIAILPMLVLIAILKLLF